MAVTCDPRKPHFMELAGAFLIFALGITAGGLALGYLTTNQNYEFDNVVPGALITTDSATTPVKTDVGSFTSAAGGVVSCMDMTNPDDVELIQTKMKINTPPAQGFLAAGIIAILVGVVAFAHLIHLGNAYRAAEAA